MKQKDLFMLILTSLLSILLMTFSPDAKQGAQAGLSLAQSTIIPSLLPVLIIFMLIIKSSASTAVIKLFGRICTALFNLPPSAATAIILGLIGGYPTGALLIYELVLQGELDKKDAKRMLRFNFCGGGGFIISAVGTSVLGSTKAGAIILLSNILSNIIIGVTSGLFEERKEYVYDSVKIPSDLGTALNDSVSASVNSVLNIAAFVTLFSAFDSVLNLPRISKPIMEITSGICTGNHFSLPLTAAFLAFGGICIHLQLLPIILKCKMKYVDFLLFRILSGAISYAICLLIFRMFPSAKVVWSNAANPIGKGSVNCGAMSALLIFGCFVMICDIASKRKAV